MNNNELRRQDKSSLTLTLTLTLTSISLIAEQKDTLKHCVRNDANDCTQQGNPPLITLVPLNLTFKFINNDGLGKSREVQGKCEGAKSF